MTAQNIYVKKIKNRELLMPAKNRISDVEKLRKQNALLISKLKRIKSLIAQFAKES